MPPPPSLPGGRVPKRRRKGAQQTIEDVLFRAKTSRISSPATSSAAAPSSPPPAAASSPIPVGDSDSDSDSDVPVRTSRPSKVVSKDEEEEEEEEDDDDDVRPAKRQRIVTTVTHSNNDSDSDSDLPIRTPRPSKVASKDDEVDDDDDVRPAKRQRTATKVAHSDSDSDSNNDSDSDADAVVVTTPQNNRRSRLVHGASSPPPPPPPPLGSSSAIKRSATRSVPSARAARQRHMELLRRRRMGEKVTESDLEREGLDGGDGDDDNDDVEATPRIALYDKDPNHVALSDFEDEEEEEEEDDDDDDEEAEERRRKEKKRRKKEEKKREKKRKKKEAKKLKHAETLQLRSKFDDDEEDDGYDYDGGHADGQSDEAENDAAAATDDDDMADFIDDTTLGVLGAPDGSDAEDEAAMLRREMPLQFTFQAHKPLQSHFKDAVEWLVHRALRRANGDSSKPPDDELYRVAWDRLDREVGGLAQSRFISSVWTPAFHSTLRARPYMDSFSIRTSGGGGGSSAAASRLLVPGLDENVCHACGRTNHPASYQVTFSGKVYNSKTLDDLDEDDGEEEEVDYNGNAIAPTSQRWLVGVTCHSNAETAHSLLHWRRALRDWVEEKMQADRVLAAFARKMKKSQDKDKDKDKDKEKGASKKKEKKRQEKMLRKMREFGYKVADDWEANGTINSLFREFKKMLEEAQVKSNKTPSRFGR